MALKVTLWGIVLLSIPLSGAATLPAWGLYLSAGFYAVLSGLSVGLYVKDKRAARRNESRIPEKHLQWLALAGGWPGALLARALLPHKRRKLGFSALLFAIVLSHQAAWVCRLITIWYERPVL